MAMILCKNTSTNKFGWHDESSAASYARVKRDNDKIGLDTSTTVDGTYLVRDGDSVGWRYILGIPKYIVTFNANGGTCSESSRSIQQGNTIGTLPTASRDGYEFGGWFTSATGGLKIDANYSINSNVTFYARWGSSSDIQFGEATSQFNIQYNGDRTNIANCPYTLYGRYNSGSSASLTFQTGISSTNGTNNITTSNRIVKLYLKITNNGNAGEFDIGFDCDSYIPGDNNDSVIITRLSNGVRLGSSLTVTVPYNHTAWVGQYSIRRSNRYVNMSVGSTSGGVDSGYAFTMNNIFINNGSYTILEITFSKL